MNIKKVTLPENSMLSKTNFDYVDCYMGELNQNIEKINSVDIGKAFFTSSPKWIEKLLNLRNRIVSKFGLKTSDAIDYKNDNLKNFKAEIGEQVGLFKVFQKTESELVLGEDDKHLNFKVSLLLNKLNQNLTIITAVSFNNWFGKLYFTIIKPFHKIIVPIMLKGTIKQLEMINDT
ncbi:DUF2867 domain-containing protein [Flavobacteriaceae bacterium AH-315-B10]|nr:DUF2867 domain-containing protein [Flavobacteriaceae bacterium AH-315-B10]